MKIEQLYTTCLAQGAYYISSNGEVAIIDPLRETQQYIDRANRDGVNYLLTISTEDKSFDKILNIISNNKCVFGSYGIHTHEAKNHQSIKSGDIIKKTKVYSTTYDD